MVRPYEDGSPRTGKPASGCSDPALSWGKQGFDFLGCQLRKRMSGPIWEKQRKRAYFLQRWPSRRSMKRVRQRVKELTGKNRSGVRDVRVIIDDLNPVLRGWGNYFRTGNAARTACAGPSSTRRRRNAVT